jgi:hypothetical protein
VVVLWLLLVAVHVLTPPFVLFICVAGSKKKSIKERVATVIYVPNNHASIPASAVPEQDSTYCHISRLLDVIKILPISSDISDIGVVLVYVNGIEVTHDMRLHDQDIITIAVMSTAIPDAVSCYKFFQVGT